MKNIPVNKKQQGFTLIELMIVVAIIGILAAIAMPAYKDYIVKANATSSVAAVSGEKIKVAEAYSIDGSLGCKTSGTPAADAANIPNCTGAGILAVAVDGITATLTPTGSTTGVTWGCVITGSGAVPIKNCTI